MEEFGVAMEEMRGELANAFEDEDLPSGDITGSVNGVEFSGTVAEVMRAMKENFDAEGFAEQIERSALEGVAGAFEEMAYEKDSIKVINDDREEWRDPLDVIAELPAKYAVPALERLAEGHDDAARRQKSRRSRQQASIRKRDVSARAVTLPERPFQLRSVSAKSGVGRVMSGRSCWAVSYPFG